MVQGKDIINAFCKYTGPKISTLDLIVYSYQKGANLSLPKSYASLLKKGREVKKNELQAADIIFIEPNNVGLSLGGNQYLIAPPVGDVIKVLQVKKFYTARRIIN